MFLNSLGGMGYYKAESEASASCRSNPLRNNTKPEYKSSKTKIH